MYKETTVSRWIDITPSNEGSLRPVNIFSRPHRLQASHIQFFLSLSTLDISNSRVDFSSDDSSRTRRVVTTRQQFQPASPPPVSSHTRFFPSLSPLDIFKSRVDFSSDGSSRTRHFQKVPQTFFQVATSCYFTSANTTTRLPLDGSSSPKSRPDSIRVY